MKICSKCHLDKKLDDFHRNKYSKDGRRSQCKACYLVIEAERRTKNRDKIKEQQSAFRQRHRSRLQKKYKSWRENRKEPGANARYSREYQKRNRLAYNLRVRLRRALKGNTKMGSAIQDLGCSIGDLKIYLEAKFQPGMTWENYGEWQIDHIIPLSYVDLTDREQFRKVCHYTNLQPLWKVDNCSKGNKCPEESGL